MNLIGVDLAWQSDKNTSAAVAGELQDNALSLHAVRDDLHSMDAVTDFIASIPRVAGLAIDAPLIIPNAAGQRACEKELGCAYGSRKAACHPANLALYPEAPSVELSNRLVRHGFTHLGTPNQERWQIECYPHPAIIEMFGLTERLLYKKGNVAAKRQGQVKLAGLIRRLSESRVLRLLVAPCFDVYLDEPSIEVKRGRALKRNEDALDAMICTYIAALYAQRSVSSTYGDLNGGYIYVPQVYCL